MGVGNNVVVLLLNKFDTVIMTTFVISQKQPI